MVTLHDFENILPTLSRGEKAQLLKALVQIGSCGDFGRGRCVDPETDQAANAACQIS